jgi:hypothetical protein
MYNLIPLEYQDLIRYDPESQIVIYIKDCNAAIAGQALRRHLHDIHKMSAKQYKPLLKAISKSKLPVRQNISDFPRPSNDSSPVQGLKIHDGYQCTLCLHELTTSENMAIAHASRHQRTPGASIIAEYKTVSIQT